MTQRLDSESNQPVVVDLGAISRKDLKLLRRGEGGAMQEVNQVLRSVKASGVSDGPVVVLYRKKRKKATGKFPLPFPFPFA